MLALVGLLAMVLVLIKLVQRPQAWGWFFSLSEGKQVKPEADSTVYTGQSGKPINVKRWTPPQPLPSDQFYARVGDLQDEVAEADDPSDLTTPATATPGTDAPNTSGDTTDVAGEAGDQPAQADEPFASFEPRQLPSEWLTELADDWFEQTRREQPSLVRIMRALLAKGDVVAAAPADDLATFDAMLSDPDFYRGRLVKLQGRLKRYTSTQVGVGAEKVPVWEAWILPNDSRGMPFVVLCAEATAGLPVGMELDEAVTVRGYLLRRYAYASQGESRSRCCLRPRQSTGDRPRLPPGIRFAMKWSGRRS
ncbi:MAG: hypothetical protein R3B90_10995 [Planctomycetaceae bacterium]